MGKVDIENLFKIYYEINKIKKKHDLFFKFKIDSGNFETAIEFRDDKHFHPPISADWSNNPIIFCPDLLDYSNRIIIEYEEEIGDRKEGAHFAKKGHHRQGDLPNKRDERRNNFYKKGGFHFFQIWKCETTWKKKLELFLLKLEFKND